MDTKIIEMMPRRTDKSADDPTYKSEVGFEHVEGDDDVTANENDKAHPQSTRYHGPEAAQAERRLVRKLDLLIMPISITLCSLFVMSRSVNLFTGLTALGVPGTQTLELTSTGNANGMGLTKDILKGSDSEYAWVASVFYFSYIIFQIPGTFGPKFVLPNLWIGCVAIIWGTAAASQAGTHSYAGIMAARFFLGIGEAGFGSAIPLLFSFWYTKREIGFRLSIFIGSAAAAGVFGGLLAYGVQHIKSTALENWRILFLIESIPVILVGFLCLFILPGRPATTKWLNEEERALALSRLSKEVSMEKHGSFNKRHIVMAIKDYRLALCYIIYMGVNIALSSLGNFLPAIVAGMGFAGARAQLMTVPPYSVAFVVMTLANFLSDRTGRRGPFVAFFMLLGSIGYILLLANHHNNHVRYGAIFLVTSGTYTTIPLMLSWVAANAGSETQRVIGLAGLNMFGQCFSILAAHIYPASSAPYYTLGYSLSCAFQLAAAIIAILLMLIWGADNRQRDRLHGKPDPTQVVNTAELGDRAPNFRYML